jgi:hypothetical protein
MNKKNKKLHQYTLRGVPEEIDHVLREKAAEYGSSLNETLLKALQKGLGITEPDVNTNFDSYAGTWVEDSNFDDVIKDFEKV